jgi:hypothetical protein
MKEFSKYIGVDVPKETIAVAVAEAPGGDERLLRAPRRQGPRRAPALTGRASTGAGL